MSTSFKEFLKEHAAREEGQAKAARASIDEWRKAIEGLFGQIRGWLADSDPDGIIQIEQTDHEVREEGLGRYRVPRLDLRAFGKWVGIIPKARNTVATARPPQKSAPDRATGRVDMTDELVRYILFRFPKEGGGDVWLIDDLRSNGPKPLDQQAFEAALMSYLR
jgi:hypothetical protein